MNDIKAFQNFLDTSVSAYHATANLMTLLEQENYTRLYEHEAWELKAGGKYYLVRGGTTLLAFRIPEVTPLGFMMRACHTDRPTFKLKDNCELRVIYTRLATEKCFPLVQFDWRNME